MMMIEWLLVCCVCLPCESVCGKEGEWNEEGVVRALLSACVCSVWGGGVVKADFDCPSSLPIAPQTEMPPISLLLLYTQSTGNKQAAMVRTFMPQPTREDAQVLLAKRFFLMGCLGLPWLWAVSVLYFWPRVYSGRSSSSTGTGSSSSSGAARRDGGNPELRKWVGRSLVGAVVGFGLLFGWVILFQLRWREWGSGVLNYMISAPESYSSGW